MASATIGTAKGNYVKELVRLQTEYHGIILKREKRGYSLDHEAPDTDLSYMSRISNMLENMPNPSLEDLQTYFGIEIPVLSSIARGLRISRPRSEVIEAIFGTPAEKTRALSEALGEAMLPHSPIDLGNTPMLIPQSYFVTEEQRKTLRARWQEAEDRAVELGREMLETHRHTAAHYLASLQNAYYPERESHMPELKRTAAST